MRIVPLGIAAALAVCLAGPPRAAAGDAPVVLTADACKASVSTEGIRFLTPGDQRLLTVTGLQFRWSPPVARIERVGLGDDGRARVDYAIEKDDTGTAALHAFVSVKGDTLRIEYHLAAPAKLRVAGIVHLRRALGDDPGEIFRTGLWTRDPRGGEPFERQGGTFRRFPAGDNAVWEVIPGNVNWGNFRDQHIRFAEVKPAKGAEETVPSDEAPDAILDLEADAAKRVAEEAARLKETGMTRYVGVAEFVLAPAALSADTLAARRGGRAWAVTLRGAKPFSLWETGDGAPAFTVSAVPSGAGKGEGATVKTVVRDFDGKMVLDRSETVAAGASLEKEYTLDGAGPGIYFVESAVEGSRPRAFSTTMLAVKEPYAYRHPEDNFFGLAAMFAVPSKDDVTELIQKMGVRRLRNNDRRKFPPEADFVVNAHTSYKPDEYKTPEAREKFIRGFLKECDARGAEYWEFGNETKLHLENRIGGYMNDWIVPIAAARKELGVKVKLMSMGHANGFGGVQSLKAVHDVGAWPHLEAVAYHLGRGNITPDARSAGAGGWNYLPSLLALKKAVKEFGDRPIQITEAYACTKPNSWWHDSLRIAADSVVLSHVIARAEGVSAVFWYQLHDSVWANVGNVNPDNPEYHFGILRRDGTPKPSLLAYCAVARALDGAKFAGYLKAEPESTLRAAQFTTPEGPVAVLWDRAEGYVQSRKTDDFLWPDPWVKHYTKQNAYTFPVKGGKVRVADAIGRMREVAAKDGRVSLTLDGSPVMVYGLELAADRLTDDLAEVKGASEK